MLSAGAVSFLTSVRATRLEAMVGGAVIATVGAVALVLWVFSADNSCDGCEINGGPLVIGAAGAFVGMVIAASTMAGSVGARLGDDWWHRRSKA